MITTETKTRKRRERVERNIYKRTDARGKTLYEVGYRDSRGKQRFKVIGPRLTAARAERDSILGRKGKGGRVEPNPRLTFGEASEHWLEDQVSDLREQTRLGYDNALRNHLVPRWGRRRLDSITVTDASRLVRELRKEGKSEWTIAGILKCARRVFKFARRHLEWQGTEPISALENGERPKVSAAPRRRVFVGTELDETVAAATESTRTLIAILAVTGCRISEALGLVWADLSIDHLDDASVHFTFQLGRDGKRHELKTEESKRRNVLPRDLAARLAERKAASPHSQPQSFIFSTRSGRALSQRNASRTIRAAMKAAKTEDGKPTFPELSAKDAEGKALPVPSGSVPTVHSIRHTAASRAIHDGDSAEDVAFQLGHRSSVVTASIYIHELKSAKRSSEQRAKLTTRFGSLMEAATSSKAQDAAEPDSAEVVDLGTKRRTRQ